MSAAYLIVTSLFRFDYWYFSVFSEDGYAAVLLQQLAHIYNSMDRTKQARVCKRVMFSGALPISRDTPSYVAMMSVLNGKALIN